MLKRLLSSAPFGLAVTLALLLSMQRLLALDLPTLPPSGANPIPVWIANPKVADAVVIDDLWEPIPPMAPPPGLPPSDPLATNLAPVGVDHSGLRSHPLPTLSRDFNVLPEGPLVRLLAVEPTYPLSAERLGLEGEVTVRFDVTAKGDVHNVEVIESSNRMFDSSAVRATQKFRFKPRVVDGVALASLGVRYRFQFRMKD